MPVYPGPERGRSLAPASVILLKSYDLFNSTYLTKGNNKNNQGNDIQSE